MPIMRRPILACLAAGMLTSGLHATDLTAQPGGPTPLSRTQFGVGYVGNAPDAMVGGAAYVLFPRWGGIGIYVDAKFDGTSPADERGYDPDYTSGRVANEVEGADFIKTEGSWHSFNVAIMRPLTPSFVAYAGGGVAKVDQFDLYNVPLATPVGFGGTVWAENPETAETRVNFMVGFMMRMTGRVTAQFGYETQPDGVTAGVSLRLPSW